MITETSIDYKDAVGGTVSVDGLRVPAIKISDDYKYCQVFKDALSDTEAKIIFPDLPDGLWQSVLVLCDQFIPSDGKDFESNFSQFILAILNQPHHSTGLVISKTWLRQLILNYNPLFHLGFEYEFIAELNGISYLHMYKIAQYLFMRIEDFDNGIIAQYKHDTGWLNLPSVQKANHIFWYEDGRIEVVNVK